MTPDIRQKIEAFFAKYPTKTFEAGQILLHPDEEPDGVMLIESGQIIQYDISPKGHEVVVNAFKPPAFFPMSWAVNGTPNHYFWETTLPTVVRRAPAQDAVQFLKDNPDVTFDLLARVYRGTDGLLRRTAHLMGGDAKSRLLFELLNATYRFGQSKSNGGTFVAMSEGDIAKRSGLTRETVNRIMRKLKDNGLVEVEKGGITIRSAEQLVNALGDDL